MLSPFTMCLLPYYIDPAPQGQAGCFPGYPKSCVGFLFLSPIGQRHWVYYAALAAAVIVLAVAAVMLLRGRGSPKELRGTWIYDSTTEYTFDGEKSGAMRVQGTDYAFTYRVRGSVVTLTFEHDAIETANYRFKVDGDTLVLAGEEGTSGGVYQLLRLPEEE